MGWNFIRFITIYSETLIDFTTMQAPNYKTYNPSNMKTTVTTETTDVKVNIEAGRDADT